MVAVAAFVMHAKFFCLCFGISANLVLIPLQPCSAAELSENRVYDYELLPNLVNDDGEANNFITMRAERKGGIQGRAN